jgi:predicted NACHT family NTPase
LKSEKNVAEFMANTFAYVRESEYSELLPNTIAPPPLVAASLFVLGPPKSGKTMFAQRIAINLDLVYLNVPIVLEAILEGKDDSLLHDKVSNSLNTNI